MTPRLSFCLRVCFVWVYVLQNYVRHRYSDSTCNDVVSAQPQINETDCHYLVDMYFPGQTEPHYAGSISVLSLLPWTYANSSSFQRLESHSIVSVSRCLSLSSHLPRLLRPVRVAEEDTFPLLRPPSTCRLGRPESGTTATAAAHAQKRSVNNSNKGKKKFGSVDCLWQAECGGEDTAQAPVPKGAGAVHLFGAL
jgi:hypothetical protein